MTENLKEIYEIINGVLKSINQPVLGENEMLESENLDLSGYERFWSLKEDGKLFFMIEVDETGVTFHIDRTDEIPEYSYRQIIDNREEFEKVLETLFTKRSRIKYKGNKTTVEFIDQEGVTIYNYSLYAGIGFSFFSKEKVFEYPPFFPN